jgi:hypothetical protein
MKEFPWRKSPLPWRFWHSKASLCWNATPSPPWNFRGNGLARKTSEAIELPTDLATPVAVLPSPKEWKAIESMLADGMALPWRSWPKRWPVAAASVSKMLEESISKTIPAPSKCLKDFHPIS